MLEKIIDKGLAVTGVMLGLVAIHRQNQMNYWVRGLFGIDRTTNTLMCVEDYLKEIKKVEAK